MHRSTHKAGSAYQRHPDMPCGQIQDRGQAGLRDDYPCHDNVNLVVLDVAARIQGEPVAAVANVFDVPKPRYENVRHLVRVDKQVRLLNLDKHDALPSRARRDAERPSYDKASHGSPFSTEGLASGYGGVNA